MFSRGSIHVVRRMKLIRTLPVVLVALAMWALAASPAAAIFGAPFDLSETGLSALNPQVAVAPDGAAVFTWNGFSAGGSWRIRTRARSAAGALSPIQTLSPSRGEPLDPQVAVDGDGDAVFTWLRDRRVEARARSAAGVLGPVEEISDPGPLVAAAPEVAVDADGAAVLVWARPDGHHWRIQARTRSAAGVLGPVQNLSPAGRDAYDFCVCPGPQVAMDADGDAVITWARYDRTHTRRIQARALSAAGALSDVQTLSDAGQDAFGPQVAVDDDGDAVFTWQRSDGANLRAETRARSASGALSAVQMLSDAGQDAFDPEVAVDADGDALFAWQRSDGAIQARARSAAGALTRVRTLGGKGHNPEVAVDAEGDAVVAWVGFDGADSRIQARSRSATGALGTVQTLSDAGQDAASPQLAADVDGDATVVWEHFDGANMNWQVQGAIGP